MRWRCSIVASLLFIAMQASSQVYVSARGKDSAKGTNSSPVATISHATELARAASAHTVILESGMYRLAKPLILTAKDSGLTLKAAPGAKVVVSGGQQLLNWRQDGTHHWWKTTLPAGVPIPRQIYVDGVRARRTHGSLPVELKMTSTGYIASSDALANWRNPQALEMVYTGGNGVWGLRTAGLGSWTQPRCPVASIVGTTITMAEPCWENSTARVMLPNGRRSANLVGPASVGKQPTEIENAYELLGRPGEFYADPVTRTIYYTPRPGENLHTADVETPVLETLLSVDGAADAPVQNITVSGITFSYAAWMAPSTPEGFSEIQANFRVTGKDGATKQALCGLVPGGTCPFASWTPEPGNVRASFADHITFQRDVFTHLGAAGLSFIGGAHEDNVVGCIFTDISGNGVELGSVNEPMAPDARFAVNNKIRDNVFTNVGTEFRGGIPIVVGYARYTQIAHNDIFGIPYAAISIGWGGWMDKIEKPGVANRSTGNVIEKNQIKNFMLVLSDGGGIYTQGRTGKSLKDGELVAGNVIENQVSSGHMLYTDNGSAMITVRGNVAFGTNFDNWGSRHKDYYDGGTGSEYDPLAIEDNWWEQGEADSNAKQVIVQGNHLISALEQAPKDVLEAAGLEPEYRDLLHSTKVFHAPEPPSAVSGFIAGNSAYVSWREPVFDGGSPVMGYIVRDKSGPGYSVTAQQFTQFAYAKIPLSSTTETHRFTVEAVNVAGTSGPSLSSPDISSSAALPPAPGELQRVAVYESGSRASIHFGMPITNGQHLIALVVAVDDMKHMHTFTGHRIVSLEGKHNTFFTMDGLSAGLHKFGVAAVSGSGRGAMVWVEGKELEH